MHQPAWRVTKGPAGHVRESPLNPINLLVVVAGGAFGTVARYLVAVTAGKLLRTSFPWGTIIINVVRSFVLGR